MVNHSARVGDPFEVPAHAWVQRRLEIELGLPDPVLGTAHERKYRAVGRRYGSRPPRRSEVATAPASSSSAPPANSDVIWRCSRREPICDPSFL